MEWTYSEFKKISVRTNDCTRGLEGMGDIVLAWRSLNINYRFKTKARKFKKKKEV